MNTINWILGLMAFCLVVTIVVSITDKTIRRDQGRQPIYHSIVLLLGCAGLWFGWGHIDTGTHALLTVTVGIGVFGTVMGSAQHHRFDWWLLWAAYGAFSIVAGFIEGIKYLARVPY
jgi:hypothetical protein